MISLPRQKVWIYAGALSVGVAIISVSFFVRSTGVSGSGQQASVSQAKVSPNTEVWTCPMHPQIKRDAPGSCPICGMSLVKAGADTEVDSAQEHAGHAVPEAHAPFKLSLTRQQMIGVRTGDVEKKMLFKSIEAAGRVAFDPELYTAQNEYIEALKQEQRVKASPIAEVRHSAARMLESAKLRLKILGLSDKQIALISVSGSTGDNLLIPNPGETLWVYAEVFEQDLPNVHPGLEAVLSGGSLGGRTVIGKVVSVDRVINPTTRTAKVRVSVPGGKALLRPEAYVDVSIRSPLGEQTVVPMDAVFDTGKQAWVFVVQEDGTFEPRIVTLRYRADEEIAIETGAEPGERIVTSANFLIDSESRLKGVLASQSEMSSDGRGEAKTPSCPKGQVWSPEMKHCMAKVGE